MGFHRAAPMVPAVGLLALLSCSSPPPVAPAPETHVLEVGRAFLWEVSGGALGEGRAYLLGSIHVLDVPLELGPRLRGLFEGADELILEAHGDVDPRSLMDFADYFGRFPPAERLSDHLNAKAFRRLERFHEAYPAPEALIWDLEGTRPWLHVFWMLGSWLNQAGVQAEWGAEATFTRAAGERIPILGLETFAEALEAMSRVPIVEQAAELMDLLAAWDGDGPEAAGLPELLDAWKRGDGEALSAAARMRPGFTEHLVVRRNEVMASRMAERFALPGTRFVVVGAAHFRGEGSIPDRLRARGFRVEPLR